MRPPSGVYFSALLNTCSTTNRSHFSSVTTVRPMGRYSSVIRRSMNSPANRRTAGRTMSSTLYERIT